jgi:hypothetical protein
MGYWMSWISKASYSRTRSSRQVHPSTLRVNLALGGITMAVDELQVRCVAVFLENVRRNLKRGSSRYLKRASNLPKE